MQKIKEGDAYGNHFKPSDRFIPGSPGIRNRHPGKLAPLSAKRRTELPLSFSGSAPNPPPAPGRDCSAGVLPMGAALSPRNPPRLHRYCSIWTQQWQNPGALFIRHPGHQRADKLHPGSTLERRIRRSWAAAAYAGAEIQCRRTGATNCRDDRRKAIYLCGGVAPLGGVAKSTGTGIAGCIGTAGGKQRGLSSPLPNGAGGLCNLLSTGFRCPGAIPHSTKYPPLRGCGERGIQRHSHRGGGNRAGDASGPAHIFCRRTENRV